MIAATEVIASFRARKTRGRDGGVLILITSRLGAVVAQTARSLSAPRGSHGLSFGGEMADQMCRYRCSSPISDHAAGRRLHREHEALSFTSWFFTLSFGSSIFLLVLQSFAWLFTLSQTHIRPLLQPLFLRNKQSCQTPTCPALTWASPLCLWATASITRCPQRWQRHHEWGFPVSRFLILTGLPG